MFLGASPQCAAADLPLSLHPARLAANYVQGVWNQSIMQAGRERLLRIASAAASAQALVAGGRAGGGGSSSNNSRSSSSSRSSTTTTGTGGPAGAPLLIADFVVGSRAEWQKRFVQQYLGSQQGGASAGAAGRMLVLLSLCVWEVDPNSVWPR